MFRRGNIEQEPDPRASQHLGDPSGSGEPDDEIIAEPALQNPTGMPLKAMSGCRDQVAFTTRNPEAIVTLKKLTFHGSFTDRISFPDNQK